MAHYALLDGNNIVTQVFPGRDEDDLIDGVESWEAYYGELMQQKCVRTSYNGNIRKNFAGIGYRYDEQLDAFIPPQPYSSWILNEETCHWEAPVPYPEDGVSTWDEATQSWVGGPNA